MVRRAEFTICSGANPDFRGGNEQNHFLEDELYVDGISDWRSVRPNSRPETQRLKHISKLPVVIPVTGLIESQELRISLLVYIEVRDEVITSHRRRCGKRRKKELSWRWRIAFRWAATGSRTIRASRSRSNA